MVVHCVISTWGRNSMRIRSIVLGAAMFGFTAVPAMAQNGVKAGLLSCRTGPSVGLIIGSHQHMHCRFDPDNRGPAEAYSGAITRVGLDVGIRAGGVMGWAVYAPTSALPHHALRGRYVGASGDASFGVGAGAKLLVGGSHHTISLQPIALSGQVGLNLALGVAGLTLR
jgi:Protein of unknown function (DUF992)